MLWAFSANAVAETQGLSSTSTAAASMQGFVDPDTGRPTAPDDTARENARFESPQRSFLQSSNTPLTIEHANPDKGKMIILGPSFRSTMTANIANKRPFAQCEISQKHKH